MRVLVTGLGGEIGTRVAQLLEAREEVTEIVGVDFVPPRRRLQRTGFARIDPRDREKLVQFVTDFAPTAVAHVGVYEPHSRMSPRTARESTEACTIAALGAAARTGKRERIAVRSGLEVYGRGRGRPSVPDEQTPPSPTTPYGRECLDVEVVATGIGRRSGIPVAALRHAPVVGSHVPSPLGRLLRLPVVPVPAFADPPFALLSLEDASRSFVEALCRGIDGPLNVVGSGAATSWQATRLGGRIPFPVFGPGWTAAIHAAELAGAPVPPHVAELIRHGRVADGSKALDVLALSGVRPTQQVCVDLYEWAVIVPLRRNEAAA